MTSALSEYQRRVWQDCDASIKPTSCSNRLFELVETGLTISEAVEEIGISRNAICRSAPRELWNRIKRMSKANTEDRRKVKFTSQRKFEEIVNLMTGGLDDGEWAIPRPPRTGQHLVGKRHNYRAQTA